jgi:Zinc-finger double-stranded RNA-binding
LNSKVVTGKEFIFKLNEMAQKAAGSKVDKHELKRLMREEKAKRIESPLAKYNNLGQLTCVVCNQTVKSELFWTAHLNSKGHLQQIEALKSSSKAKTAPKVRFSFLSSKTVLHSAFDSLRQMIAIRLSARIQ